MMDADEQNGSGLYFLQGAKFHIICLQSIRASDQTGTEGRALKKLLERTRFVGWNTNGWISALANDLALLPDWRIVML